MGLYSYRASTKLKDLLARAKDGGTKERLDLGEELDLARVLCERSIHLFDVSCLDEEKSKTVEPELKQAAKRQLEESLKLVADLTQQYAKLLVVSDEVFNAAQMEFILQGIAEVLAVHLEDHLKEDADLIDRIVEGIGKLCAPEKGQGRAVNITIG